MKATPTQMNQKQDMLNSVRRLPCVFEPTARRFGAIAKAVAGGLGNLPKVRCAAQNQPGKHRLLLNEIQYFSIFVKLLFRFGADILKTRQAAGGIPAAQAATI